MNGAGSLTVEPLGEDDLPAVAALMHAHMNPRIPVADWERSYRMPWARCGPHYGYGLWQDGRLAGAYTVIWSRRTVDGREELFGNLAAWCVEPELRLHSLSLLKQVLADKQVHLTDLSPKPEVARLMRRFGFEALDTTWCLMPNLPWWGLTRILTDPAAIAARLAGDARQVFEDHRDVGAVHHLLLDVRDRPCHVMYHRRTRKGVPCVTVLHVSEPAALPGRYLGLGGHFLRRERALLTVWEDRFLVRRPLLSRRTASPHAKLFRSPTLGPGRIDNLYSELVTLAEPGSK
ncbi:MAG: hypothetical protein R3F30_01410 [Planctomycetota bacterium]